MPDEQATYVPLNNLDQISMLPNSVIQNALRDVIIKEAKTDKCLVKVEQGSAKGDNYIGIVYRVRVKIQNLPQDKKTSTMDNSDDDDLSVFLKLPPQNAIRRKQFFTRPTFLRESLMYEELLPLAIKFQESKGIIPAKGSFHEFPRCLGTSTLDEYEAIFLEDLRMKGFGMFSRFNDVTFDYAKLVATTLGKFHGVMFAMKDQWPDKFEKYRKMEDIFYERRNDEQLETYFEALKNRALDVLHPEENKTTIEKIKNCFAGKKYIDVMLETVNGENAEPYAILCHGDCWNNNVLFKCENGIPKEISLIDWQISRYASPVTDLMYYVFACTTKEFRDAHYVHFIDEYHQALSTLVRRLGSDPEKLFPRKALDDQLKRFGKYGLMMGMMLIPIITSEVDDIPDLDELSEQLDSGNLNTDEAFRGEKSQAIYKSRMYGISVDMEQLGYI